MPRSGTCANNGVDQYVYHRRIAINDWYHQNFRLNKRDGVRTICENSLAPRRFGALAWYILKGQLPRDKPLINSMAPHPRPLPSLSTLHCRLFMGHLRPLPCLRFRPSSLRVICGKIPAPLPCMNAYPSGPSKNRPKGIPSSVADTVPRIRYR
jgi:hypothetical protein